MDYENGRFLACSNLGLSYEIETNRSGNHPHLARGESRWYALSERRRTLDVLERSGSRNTAANSIGCSVWSLTSWEDRAVLYRRRSDIVCKISKVDRYYISYSMVMAVLVLTRRLYTKLAHMSKYICIWWWISVRVSFHCNHA